jgi:cytochrome oxidase Cu insertion factor (SCO1/SenC/PrrC family)
MPEDLLQNTILQGRNEMGNFTITDSDGVTRTLYDELDSGKTILLDLFFTT